LAIHPFAFPAEAAYLAVGLSAAPLAARGGTTQLGRVGRVPGHFWVQARQL